jgi:broad specificity phosphatase PhoE
MSADPLPINLLFVRHGETYGNLDPTLYSRMADHAIRLTDKGRAQADAAGEFLAQMLAEQRDKDPENFGKIRLWHSPFYRARETAAHILYPLGQVFDHTPYSGVLSYREEPRLMEQKMGLFDGVEESDYATVFPNESKDFLKYAESNGRLYAKTPLGESRFDVVLRGKSLFRTILEDARRRDIRTVILVNHGATLRALTMAWMRYPPEWLDAERNPGNCWIRQITGEGTQGYVDHGYIYGQGAPLYDPMAMQRQLKNPEDIFMLAPERPGTIVPHGVITVNPYDRLVKVLGDETPQKILVETLRQS